MTISRAMRRSGLSAAIAAVVLLSVLPASATLDPGVIGNWKLRGNFKNTAGTSLKLARLHTSGTNGFQSVDVAGTTKKAFVFTAGDGLTLSRIPMANRKTFAIDIFFEFDSVTGYKRILSFGPNTKDAGLYIYNGNVTLYDHKTGSSTIVANQWVHVLVTRAGRTGAMRAYLNGSLEFRYRDAKGKYTLRKGKVVFFVDDGSEHASGTVSNIRVYNRAVAPD